MSNNRFYVDNRLTISGSQSDRDNQEPSRNIFLVSALQEPVKEKLISNQPSILSIVDVCDVCDTTELRDENSRSIKRFVYEVDIDAEITLDAYELAEEIKKAHGFVDVFPGLVSTDGSVSFSDYRELLISLQSNSAIERARFAKDHDLLLIEYDHRGNLGMYRSIRKKAPEIFEDFSKDNRVRYAELNYLGSADDAEHAELFSENGSSIDFEDYWAHELTGLNDTSNELYGDGVTIAIIDSRIDKQHRDIRDAVIVDVDKLDFCPGHTNHFVESHGTQSASVALSRKVISPNKYLGISPKAKLIPISVVLGNSDGLLSRIKALNLCAEISNKKRYIDGSSGTRIPVQRLIVNCSWQISVRPIPISFQEAFENLSQSDAVVTCSSGNDGQLGKPHFPSDYPLSISVAAVQNGDIVAKYSNINNKVNICAPGGNKELDGGKGGVITAVNGGGHRYSDGTSFAAPYAAGMVALLWSLLPNLSSKDIRELLINSCTVNILEKNPNLNGLLTAGRIDTARIALAAQNLV